MWYMCREAYIGGETVPEGVFMLTSTKVTEADIKRAEEMIEICTKKDTTIEDFGKAAESNAEFFKNT